MDHKLRQDLATKLFRTRKGLLELPSEIDLTVSELFVMGQIYKNSQSGETDIDLTNIGQAISVSKAAVSQMFASLERRGYVVRETNTANRRKIIVNLTAQGTQTIKEASAKATTMLDAILSRFGEDKAQLLISLIDELLDVTEELRQEQQQHV